uniref:Reverse transcriptase/retrotransposon-derived protein RNase H-like domain-containing protein n=1 Tax=Salarias fasciatus TaxID=181472 RepID=A0A672FQN7_SALFA
MAFRICYIGRYSESSNTEGHACSNYVPWTQEMKHAFRHVKYMLYCAPEDGNVAAGVLAQRHADNRRPVVYFSKMLPLIVEEMVAFLRAVAAAAIIRSGLVRHLLTKIRIRLLRFPVLCIAP